MNRLELDTVLFWNKVMCTMMGFNPLTTKVEKIVNTRFAIGCHIGKYL